MRIAARIWSGVSIILVGYVLTVLAGAYLGNESSKRLETVRADAVPAALQMYELQAAFRKLLATYQAAYEAGEPDQLQETADLLKALDDGFVAIAAQGWLPEKRRQDLTSLKPCRCTPAWPKMKNRTTSPNWRANAPRPMRH
jgi:hypothetical protein